MDYYLNVLILIAIQAIAAYGLNVIIGYAGQMSLGHAAFYGIGAYSCAMLTTQAGFNFWTALPLAVIISAACGFLLGLPSLRVKADFLAIATMGINFIVEAVFLYTPYFGKALGIGGIPRVPFFVRLNRAEYLWYFFAVCLLFLIIVMLVNRYFTKTWVGLSCFAVRENETAACSMGVSPVRAKLTAFVIGTAFAGLGGALHATAVRFISPTDFGFTLSITMVSVVVLGGMGTFWGPLIGAVILGLLPEIFRPLIDYRMFLYALILLLMIRFLPSGIAGSINEFRKEGKVSLNV